MPATKMFYKMCFINQFQLLRRDQRDAAMSGFRTWQMKTVRV